MRGVYYRTEKDGTPLATPELRISATNNRTVYYDNQNAKEAALQNDEIKEGSIVLTGYADGESEVVIKKEPDWENAVQTTPAQLQTGYTAPDDGIICITGTSPDNNVRGYVTVNGDIVASSIAGGNVGYRECQVQIQINKGDIVRTVDGNNNGQVWLLHAYPLFVPFKTVAEPLTLPVNVMNNPSLPDLSRAVAITVAQVQAGYSCPNNGMVIGSIVTGNTNAGNARFEINGVWISGTNTIRDQAIDLNFPVSKNDVLKFTGTDGWNSNLTSHMSFVPFKN